MADTTTQANNISVEFKGKSMPSVSQAQNRFMHAVAEGDVKGVKPSVGKELTFGLRPEHITEPRRDERDPRRTFTSTLDVVEPMGMETMVYFAVNGTEVCARVAPEAAAAPGQPMQLYANLDHMHLIDPATELVL